MYFDIHLEIDSDGLLRTKLYYKADYFHLTIVNFHLYVATFQQHPLMDYRYLSRTDILKLMVPIRISLIEGCCQKKTAELRVPIG